MGSAGVGLSRVEMRPGGRRKVSARREPHHADAIGGKTELLCPGAHQTNRALRIAELDRMAIPRPEPVLEDERGDSGRVQQVRDLPSLVIRGERLIPAAGRDDD